VIFTLVSQLVVGAFLLLFLAKAPGSTAAPAAHPALHATLLIALLGFETIALVLSTLHLGRPHRFYRAFNNLRYSPVSREVAAVAVFYNLLGGYTLFTALSGAFAWLPASWVAGIGQACGWGAAVAGPAALFFMSRIYRIQARPFWNHWQVLTSFYGSMLALGALAVALPYGWLLWAQGEAAAALLAPLAGFVALGLALEGVGLAFHAPSAQDRRRGPRAITCNAPISATRGSPAMSAWPQAWRVRSRSPPRDSTACWPGARWRRSSSPAPWWAARCSTCW
jgi:DMSO reductase anchor subunit